MSACQHTISEKLVPQLRTAIGKGLSDDPRWTLNLDGDDPDSQIVQFVYPLVVVGSLSPYFASSVKLELGARSDHFPVETGQVRPYLQEALAELLTPTLVQVRVLAAERTFWEKATILHAHAQLTQQKLLPLRLSRRYYDLFQLVNHPIGERALKDVDLLRRVATHKAVFFKSAWARYDLAQPGTFRLVPGEQRLRELERDYAKMEPMFFGTVPQFDAIVDCLRITEQRINGA